MNARTLATTMMNAAKPAELTHSFDAILMLALNGHVVEAFHSLNDALTAARAVATPEVWQRLVQLARQHHLCELVQRDPFTRRCFAKPRGYSGDATALDYVLQSEPKTKRPHEIEAQLHFCTTQGALARGLRFRRDHIAGAIDAIAFAAPRPITVFSVAGGHLREIERMRAFKAGKIARFAAFDTDSENLERVLADYARLPVAARPGTLRQLISGKHFFEDMDVIYVAGLMEMLDDGTARGLVRSLFTMLKPGGSLILTNFLESMPEAAYAETYMDWPMNYRSQLKLFGWLQDVGPESAAWSYGENEESSMGALTIQRKPAPGAANPP